MRELSLGRISLMWAAWYLALALVVLAISLAHPSFDMALPIPTRLEVSGREFGPRTATLVLAGFALLLAAVPPLAVTVIWWLRHRLRRNEQSGAAE